MGNVQFEIENSRIGFEKIREDHTDMVLLWRNSEEVKKFFIYRAYITREDHLNWLKTKVDTGEVVQFVVYDKPSNKPFGSVYLKYDPNNRDEAEYGVFIGESDYRNKGFGAEIARLMVQYGFEILGLKRIILRVVATNARAMKSYINAGFSLYDKEYIDIEGAETEVVFMECMREM